MNNSPPARISGFRAKDWIKISRAPSQVINTQLGDKVELECEVLGSPAPEIQWYKGSQLIQETERSVLNNELQDSYHDKAGLAKIKSRFIIDCVTSNHGGFYTCVARAGVKKIKSEPSLLLIEGGSSESCKEAKNEKLQPPRIISWNPTAMENMGVDVLLPCAAVGNPTPEIYWLDQDNNVVNNFRFRVLNNGDLAIYRLAWPDMGQYKCVAENSLGRDSVTTFIYPVLVSFLLSKL
ncbi:Neural/ectodermal development factor IMP-L2 precursor, putative [Pediculus humanus corporis]|uniref:Neural/ectodermal development factor IMP-L2, putative n=1 Tax=Pediculus humanus subsp. corporis TaxID=121224 RepID=E0VX35_PEDHC|nr:Neural/ectodermal development factor IMP-L2 precursor, putative [Pediculus humanus corporis]EEB17941.1 Neural/ectodermal development factor IMP-L2 precursor, putative [Pediculus humanus corporis]